MADKLSLAFIGCGRVAFHHEDMLRTNEDICVTACCDLIPERAGKLASNRNCRWYANYHDMLFKEKIDVVTIATPSGCHYEHVKDILTHHRVHVVLEKPPVLKPSQGDELKRLAEKQKTQIFLIYQNRFNKAVQRVKRSILENEIGSIVLATVRVRWCRPQRYYDLAAWRGTYAMDGGAYTNQGIHFIDILRYLAGDAEKVNSIFGTLGAKLEAEDTGVSLIQFQSGALGCIEITTAARPNDFEASVSIVGSKGMAVIAGITANQLLTFSPNEQEQAKCSEDVPTVYGFGHKQIYAGVADTLLRAKAPIIDFEDGLNTVRLLHALYASAEKRTWVNFKDSCESSYLGRVDPNLLEPYLIKVPCAQPARQA